MDVVRKYDLIGVVTLTKLFAEQNKMTHGEACDYITTKIVAEEEFPIYDRSCATLPIQILPSENARNVVFEVFNENWWKFKDRENRVISGWSTRTLDVAVLKVDAEKYFGITIDDEALQNYEREQLANASIADTAAIFNKQTKAQEEKLLSTNERNTLLTIIAALCDYSAIKHQERGAASQIATMTQEIGAAVTDDTIRKALAKIPGALETRMK